MSVKDPNIYIEIDNSQATKNLKGKFVPDKVCFPKSDPIIPTVPPDAFIFQIDTRLAGGTDDYTFALPLYPGHPYNYTIKWGDGVVEQYYNDADVTHTYTEKGIYSVEISGTFGGVYFGSNSSAAADDKTKLIRVNQWGTIAWQTFFKAFAGCSNLQVVANDAPDLNDVRSLSNMFFECESITYVNTHGWDTTYITNMTGLFSGCINMSTEPDVYNWSVSNVTHFDFMFFNCHAMIGAPRTGNWHTNSLKTVNHMFSGCNSMNETPDVSNWSTSLLTSMSYLFYNCNNVPDAPDVSNWNISGVTNLNSIFREMHSITTPPDISSWDVSNVTLMSYLFLNNRSVITPPDISSWDMSNVTSVFEMFRGCTLMTTPDISSWVTTELTNANRLFYQCPLMNPDPSKWGVRKLEQAYSMLEGTSYDQVNYEKLLDPTTGWPSQPVQYYVHFHAGEAIYTLGSVYEDGKNILISAPELWTITDGYTGELDNTWDDTLTWDDNELWSET